MSSSRSDRGPLTRDSIVEAAVAIADTDGIDAVSMRVLARRLGYEPMSLYNHVANKGALLTEMVDSVAASVPSPDVGEDPLVAVRAHAVATRAALVRHPWAATLCLGHLPGPARVRHMEDLLAVLALSDLPEDLAHHAFHAVTNHVLGYTLQEQAMMVGVPAGDAQDDLARTFLAGISGGEFPHMVHHVQQHLDGESSSSFELVLDLILDGLVRLADGTTQR